MVAVLVDVFLIKEDEDEENASVSSSPRCSRAVRLSDAFCLRIMSLEILVGFRLKGSIGLMISLYPWKDDDGTTNEFVSFNMAANTSNKKMPHFVKQICFLMDIVFVGGRNLVSRGSNLIFCSIIKVSKLVL